MSGIAVYRQNRDAILSVIDEAMYPAWWLDEKVESGAFQIIHNERGMILIEVMEYPSGMKGLRGWFAFGDRAAIVEQLIPLAEQYAIERGCRVAVIDSRGGWSKALKQAGYRAHNITIVKEL